MKRAGPLLRHPRRDVVIGSLAAGLGGLREAGPSSAGVPRGEGFGANATGGRGGKV